MIDTRRNRIGVIIINRLMRVFLSKEYRDAFGRLVANEMENCRIRKLEL